ncbi:Type I secretion system membrane fusion protein PrsE [Posidoniimonas corsicana]|uniref:Type I secretion system membrane fusion protein PrsE n=1 Tax=Posidoniimonas corsicana TaxID=1938618 RepID=A0A5C5VD10_9BACT|nr:HlyD family efflux transporter periplasmic adaptor subunit [Posidoniimonas corsicana]TWT35545.1 Type I secretion system membrane fusion protein PrsE [Posidoniimonas corsicana]
MQNSGASTTGDHTRPRALARAAYDASQFPALRLARVTGFVRRLGKWLMVVLVLTTLTMLLAPWQQSVRGEGSVIAFDPFERQQSIQAPIKGRIAERGEGVRENAYVTKGQLLFRIEDQDPLFLSRLEQQVTNAEAELKVAQGRLERARELRDNNLRIVAVTSEELTAMQTARDELVAAYDRFVDQASAKLAAQQSKVTAAEAKRWQAEADYERKQSLFNDGIESQLKAQETEQKYRDAKAGVQIALQEVENARSGVEGKRRERESKRQEWQAKINKVMSQLEKARADVAKADIDINKIEEEINQKNSKLLDQQSKLAVQQTQEVRAPRDGFIMDLAVFDSSSIVKPGDQLCRIVPDTETPAVQAWVSGNDQPLVSAGRHVRLQFEGWPAVQFSGWPSVAVGTFGGEVAFVDPADNGLGKFRIVVVPDPDDQPWPEHPYLRQGVRANAWVLLDQVPLGYEVWRRMNGFPQALGSQQDAKSPKPPKIKI